ncbi:MAG: exo-alpha-sialidase [Bacteroidota bacterium]
MKFYILALALLSAVSFASLPGSEPAKKDAPGSAKIVFKSTDGGQTWQDISKGLPENLQEDDIKGNNFYANDKGLFLKVGTGLYHSTPNATAPFWTKESLPDEHSSIAQGKSKTSANDSWSVQLKKTDGTSAWSPIFENLQHPRIGTVFQTAEGAIFMGTEKGFLKTVDKGKSWKLVHTGALVGHLAEMNGVLLGISDRGIIRSTDNGENWAVVMSEGVAWDVKMINGGFAAITSGSESGARTLKTSFDGGKTWQPIEASLQDKVVIDSIGRTWNDRPGMQTFMNSIIQVGENFFSPTNGIFRSSDKGQTWKLLLPSVEGKFFNLFTSGNVIYAIRRKGGC